MKPKFNIWLEECGEVVLSMWRVRLLESIQKTGSITAAAESMNVPYRRAWERLQEMEGCLGEALVITEVGGIGGGGAQLTERAKDLISRFQRFTNGLDVEIERRFIHAFE